MHGVARLRAQCTYRLASSALPASVLRAASCCFQETHGALDSVLGAVYKSTMSKEQDLNPASTSAHVQARVGLIRGWKV